MMRKIARLQQSCHIVELLSVSLIFLQKNTLRVLENVTDIFPFFPSDSSSFVHSSHSSSPAPFCESLDYIKYLLYRCAKRQ